MSGSMELTVSANFFRCTMRRWMLLTKVSSNFDRCLSRKPPIDFKTVVEKISDASGNHMMLSGSDDDKVRNLIGEPEDAPHPLRLCALRRKI